MNRRARLGVVVSAVYVIAVASTLSAMAVQDASETHSVRSQLCNDSYPPVMAAPEAEMARRNADLTACLMSVADDTSAKENAGIMRSLAVAVGSWALLAAFIAVAVSAFRWVRQGEPG